MLSMFTTNSTNLVKSKNDTLAAIFARRLVLFLSFLLIGWGSAWGQLQSIDLTSQMTTNGEHKALPYSTYKDYSDGGILELTFDNSYSGTIVQLVQDSNWGTNWGLDGSGNSVQIPLSELESRFGTNYNILTFNRWGDMPTVIKVILYVPAQDDFLNEANTNVVYKSSSGLVATEDANFEFNLSDIPFDADLSGVTYARIYVTDFNGTAIDYTTQEDRENPLLQVLNNGVEVNTTAGKSNKNGLYIYDSGNVLDLTQLTAKLNHGTGNQYRYKVIVLLSKGSMTGSGDNLKEPKWDYEYTYKFIKEIIVPLSNSDIDEQSVVITEHDAILEFFNKNNASFARNWYACWYVQNKNNEYQSISSSENSISGKWTVAHFNDDGSSWPTAAWKDYNDIMVWADHETRNGNDHNTDKDWFIQNTFANGTRISAPNKDFDGYKIIFEVTDDNPQPSVNNNPPNPFPDIKLRYIFLMPTPDPFLGNPKGNASGSGQQPIGENDVVASFILSEASGAPDNIKYVRVQLCDANGKAIDYKDNLVVTYDGVRALPAGENSVNGVYVYDSGSTLDKDKINITLYGEWGTLSNYRIKCMLATDDPASSGNVDSNGKVTHEPDWDYEYTYSFVYPDGTATTWFRQLSESILNNQSTEITIPSSEFLGFFGDSDEDFGHEWYARWYVVADLKNMNAKEPIASAKQSLDNLWVVTHYQNGTNDWPTDSWKVSDNMVWSDDISNGLSYPNQYSGWYINDIFAKGTRIAVPNGKVLDDFSGYKIVFEMTSDNPGGAPVNPPAIKLRYVFEIPESDEFLGKAKNVVEKGQGSKDIVKKDTVASFQLDVVNDAKFSDIKNVKYVRIQLCDVKGKAIEYDENLLEVMYDGNPAMKAGTKQKNGVYIYDTDNFDLSKINITLNGGFGNMNKYVIKCLLSTDEAQEMADGKVTKEPDWNYEYTYWFNYIINTKEFTESVPWRRNGMMPVASTTDLKDWETSWEELSIGINVKWYVVKNGNDYDQRQKLEAYADSRIDDTWTIDPNDYDVADNVAILKDKTTLVSTFMSTIYAPNAINEFEDAKDYHLICEIYTNNNVTLQPNPLPNARYTFTLDDDFLGELIATGKEDGETVELANKGITSLNLGVANDITTEWAKDAKYVRVWLTKTDGTLADPTDKLSIEWMTAYGKIESTDVTYGYYYTGDVATALNNMEMTLTLDLACYNQYQVRVAFSKDNNFDINIHEPDYDYLYIFGFSYPVKTKYKTLIYDTSSYECKPILLKNWMEVAGDCGEGLTNLSSKLYVRWYLAELKTDNDGNIVEELKGAITVEGGDVEGGKGYNHNPSYANSGYYKYGGFSFNTGNYKHTLNEDSIPTINLPNSLDYTKVRLICVATTKTDDYNIPSSGWVADPDEIQVKYVYTLKTEDELQNQPFVHYQGEAYRYQIDMLGVDKDSEDAKKYDYLYVGDAPEKNNLTWDIATNSPTDAGKGIRQNVHTVDYYYYVNTNDTIVKLMLPLQYYDGKTFDSKGEQPKGDDTEPKAYYRWYDYETDEASKYLTAAGDKSLLNNTNDSLEIYYPDLGALKHKRIYFDVDRGLFAFNIGSNDHELEGGKTPNTAPWHESVGVKFNASSAFGTGKKEFWIACDVSRYLDGMDESFTYLVHEPTLTVRYRFCIRPIDDITNEITTKVNANNVNGESLAGLAAVENRMMTKAPNQSISILENEGRTVVSTNAGVGNFSLRTKLSNLGHYTGQDDSRIWWYAYYKDSKGNWWRHLVVDTEHKDKDKETVYKDKEKTMPVYRSEMYQAKYSLNDLKGEWQIYNEGWKTNTDATIEKPIIDVGDRVQLVACVGTETVANENSDKPIIWTELEFIDAMPMALGSEADERTDGYMNRVLTWENTLDFNNFSLLGTKKPTNSYENYATVPLDFETAQYGFSYPQLYGLCATNWTTNWDGYGISPLHGDYILLKSMNMPKISFDADWNDQGIFCNWWNSNSELPLLDITNERLNGKFVTESEDYGGFLYVDAADEARTIASLQFNASLCRNAKIYYTAYVASMTGVDDKGEQTPPMLRFRVTAYDKDKKEYVPVVTFVTGDIKQEVNWDRENKTELDNEFKQSQWYQVYGYTTIPPEFLLANGGDLEYRVEIDNYCDNTNGADYCIDQISFYTSSTLLKVMQSGKRDCDEEGVSLNIYVNADDLKDLMVTDDIYWRIYETNENGDKPIADGALYESTSGNITSIQGSDGYYGRTTGVQSSAEEIYEGVIFTDEFQSGYFKQGNTVYFSLANKSFALKEGTEYYISVYTLNDNPAEGDGEWGCESGDCSVYSPVFVPKAMYLSAVDDDGELVTTVEANCSGSTAQVDLKMVLNMPDDTEESGFHQYKGVCYDYYLGTKAELKSYDANNISLFDAISDFRERYPKGTYTALPEYDDGKDDKYRTLISNALESGLLYLQGTPEIKLTISADHPIILAIPTENFVYYGDQLCAVCSPLEFVFDINASAGAPQIALGFDDVEYPAEGYEKQVVRVGMEQLMMMKGDGTNSNNYKLHIPVRSYSNKSDNNTTGGKLYFPQDFNYLTISAVEKTTDPILKESIRTAAVGKKFAKIEPVIASESPYVSNERMYLSLDLSSCEIEFHEGYEYEVSTSFIDAVDVDMDKPCMGDLFLVIKVVPEFVTWNPQSNGANTFYNVNWNNDENWMRSSRAELYKSENDNQNTATKAQGGIYKNNDEMKLNNPNTYVPMKFSYVTLPKDCRAPNLIKMDFASTGSNNMGGNFLEGDLRTERSPKEIGKYSEATDFIKYDMLVRYGAHKVGGEGCFGHRIINNQGEWADGDDSPENATALVFDVEKFYGNICKEIYFKPNAELINQQFLTYEKAWVEKELVAGKWYLMSSPLKETYAGDMYVPATPIKDYSTAASGEVIGRQVTEAFQAIKMTDDQGDLLNLYSRTKYPIYQRSWGMKDGTVYTQKADTYRSDYNANLNYTEWEGKIVEWGHTFNDVDVPYTTRSGFSIRAHKQDQTEKALIRLPKDDDNYSYYGYKGDKQDDAASKFKKETANIGQFVTEKNNADITLSISNAQQMGGYVLVGNPYVASLDMAKFFEGNTELTKTYYTYGYDEDENVYEATTYGENNLGIIRPLEAFFVKAKDDKITEIKFTAGMMTDGNSQKANNGSRMFALTASNDRGQSVANMSVGGEPKSVETLFDSNLEDVPMVYTVANGQAVSINQMRELDKPIAFGVTCTASDEPVNVTFSDVAQLTSRPVYVIDAVTGEQTRVDEGSTVSIQPNDYGRYFLLSEALNINEKAQKGIMVSIRNQKVVVTSDEALTQVCALLLDGTTVYQSTDGGMTASFTLAPDVYIIKAENVAGEQQTIKVSIKAK